MKPAVRRGARGSPAIGGVADPEDSPGALVDLEVDVALPVAGLDVGEPVPLVGQRAQRLAPAARTRSTCTDSSPRRVVITVPVDADPVAAVELVERRGARSAPSTAVSTKSWIAPVRSRSVREREPALAADERQPARQADPFVGHDVGREVGVGVVDPGARWRRWASGRGRRRRRAPGPPAAWPVGARVGRPGARPRPPRSSHDHGRDPRCFGPDTRPGWTSRIVNRSGLNGGRPPGARARPSCSDGGGAAAGCASRSASRCSALS